MMTHTKTDQPFRYMFGVYVRFGEDLYWLPFMRKALTYPKRKSVLDGMIFPE
jgi:hypothetical protein